jgi:hypothetical protein
MGHFQLRIDSDMNYSPAVDPFNSREMPLKWPYVTEQRSKSGKLVATAGSRPTGDSRERARDV